ncbi:MAG: TonB-dependent receptor, partial [Vicinamibacterales bacterium]
NIQDNTNRTGDGFFAIVSPRLDAIEEVSVTTAGQGADAGQGAVQIKFVTRSGGNTYTGSGYHYYRNDKLNANTWFNNRSGTAKANLLQNQFGGRFGGPLVIPGVLGRGKAFFFGNYEEFRQPSDVTRNRSLLTPSAQAGIFSYGGGTVNLLQLGLNNAATSASSSTDPTIAALLRDIRASTSGGSIESVDANIDRLVFNVATQSQRRFPTGRIDYNVTDNHRFTSAVNYNHFTDFPDTLNGRDAQFPGFPVAAGQSSIRLSISNTLRSTLSQNFVNEARVGFSGAPVKFFAEQNVGMFTGTLANQKGFQIEFPNVGSQLTRANGAAGPSSRNATDLALEDTVTFLRGNHNLTGGVSWTGYNVWLKNSSLVPRVNFGLLVNDPAQQVITSAALAGATGVTPSATQLAQAQALYAFLTGRVTSITADARLNEGSGQYEYVGVGLQRAALKESGLFIQDSWRLRPNLTINGGIRYDVQFPFTSSNNSYTTPTPEDVCGRSGVNSQTGFCNLFQPGVMPGKPNPQFFQLKRGEHAYNTDWDNIAPNIGIAWTPSQRDGFLGALMSDELVLRAGFARAYSRNGLGDFTGAYNSNPGVSLSVQRTEGLGNIIPAGESAPVLFRNDSLLGPASFATTPVYPLTDIVTEDIRMFDPNIKIPYADSWTAGVQRKLTRNMAFEARYVGTRSDNAWTTRNFNEVNIVENNFINEFRNAQGNLRANIAAGRGNTFAHFPGTNTTPLPTLLAFINGTGTPYSGTQYSNATTLSRLAERNPNPHALASDLLANATFRANAAAAGIPANFFVANPDLLGGAFFVLNSHKTKYHSMQVELRRRLSQGLQFQSSYVLSNAQETVFFTHRRDLYWQRDAGDPGDITHQGKANLVYDLPFGQGRRFMSGAGGVMERIVGGWQLGVSTKVQSGRLVDLGNVRLVGWSADDVQKAFSLRFDDAGKKIYMWPQDVIDNTIRAFNVSATSPTGYSGAAPEGRYFAPANGPDCLEVDAGRAAGECGGVRSLVVTGPLFQQTDLRVAKRTKIVGRVNIEFSAEMLNAFNTANFTPVSGISSTLSNYEVTGLSGTNTSRVVQLVSRINW